MKKPKKFLRPSLILAISIFCLTSCLVNESLEKKDIPVDIMLGGQTTTLDSSFTAFTHPASNLNSQKFTNFFAGNSLFNKNWETAPANNTERDGLGPLFNARSCIRCHSKDGRGMSPNPGVAMESMLLRLSIPGETQHGGPMPEPNYGDQLNESSILELHAEARAHVSYMDSAGNYPDGESFSLRKPMYQLTDAAYGDFHPEMLLSGRVAPQMIGLGLLENISEEDILANEDAEDKDGDGISGKANYVWNRVTWAKSLGRFGWKANEPNMEQQVAGALVGDMGITSTLFPEENHMDSQGLDSFPHGGDPEIPDDDLADLVFYSRLLAVPARRNWDSPSAIKGSLIFDELKCSKCHIRQWTTSSNSPIPELNEQVIFPFTDMLLHDMGDGLADNRPDFLANGREWRTPPLWGIGMFRTVNGHSQYLHDGRARNLEEAVLWHGGEAKKARDKFMKLNNNERVNLISFLNSL